jgi:DUF4097 and DUF4098 domain-containing protein YvlB
MRSETFSTPGKVKLDISIPSGDVDLQTNGGETTTVELEVSGKDSQEHEEDTQIELRQRGDRYEVVIAAGKNRGFSFIRGRSYSVRVTSPAETEVEAKLASADVEGRGRFGDVRIQTASGDIELEHVEGLARIDAASGDVRIEYASTLKINSASGDIDVDDVGRGGDINTASGDVSLKSVRAGALKLNSASGDLEVGIAKGSRLLVEAQSLSGDTSSDIDLESGAPIASDEGPLVELTARTLSGDISVRRA